MYGLPKDVDLKFLQGRELEQVCLGSSQAALNFDALVSIRIETAIRYYSGERLIAVYEDSPASAVALVGLLACSIVSFRASEDGTLRLVFSNGCALEIHDDDPHYECYHIRHGTLEIHV